MRILGIERDKTACNHYRIYQPLWKLQELGMADIRIMTESDFSNPEEASDKVMGADIVMFARPADLSWLNLIKTCQKAGKIIVTDYDDDPFATSPFSPAYRFLGVEEMNFQWPDGRVDEVWKDGQFGFDIERNIYYRDMFRASFQKSDLVTTTTDILADNFRKINKNVAVLPNVIDLGMFPQVEMVKRDIRIGWQGGNSHYEDLWVILDPLKKFLESHSNVKFVYWGDIRLATVFKDFPENKIEFHPWTSFDVSPYKLATLNLDIGLCPLRDTPFNRNKSALKWMDYSVMKIATIATDIPPYSPVIKHGETGVLIPNDKWYEAIDELAGNVYLQQSLAHNAYEEVKAYHNADKEAYRWRDAFKAVLNKELKDVVHV